MVVGQIAFEAVLFISNPEGMATTLKPPLATNELLGCEYITALSKAL